TISGFPGSEMIRCSTLRIWTNGISFRQSQSNCSALSSVAVFCEVNFLLIIIGSICALPADADRAKKGPTSVLQQPISSDDRFLGTPGARSSFDIEATFVLKSDNLPLNSGHDCDRLRSGFF